jgi:amidohydrolase
MKPDIGKIKELASGFYPHAVTIRRHIHKNPELSFKEFSTAEYIAGWLTEMGIPFTSGHVGTGLIGLINGEGGNSNKCVLLRADMDALPITEENDKPYVSSNPGVMHACGHDVHTACLLGAAKILNDTRSSWKGTVKLMFQPGEEVLPGGASLMIAEGVLKDPEVNSAFALHVFPSLEKGNVGFKEGMYMASTDELYLTVTGRGGHAAMVSEYVNPVLALSEIILAVNSRFMSPGSSNKVPTVVAFGKVNAAGSTNVIPAVATAAGTMRTMDEAWRAEVHHTLQAIVKEIAAKNKIECALEIRKGYPFLVNDVNLTRSSVSAAKQFLGESQVHELPLRMTAEDFAFITQQVPSCFFRLGTANTQLGITSGVHTSTFDVDEQAIETGAGLLAWLALQELAR